MIAQGRSRGGRYGTRIGWVGVLLVALAGCAGSAVVVSDVRAPEARQTHVLDTGMWVVQYGGDDLTRGGVAKLLEKRLSKQLFGADVERPLNVLLKTADVRLLLPNAQPGFSQVPSQRKEAELAKGTSVSAPIASLLTSKAAEDELASAALCVSIEGKDYVGVGRRTVAGGVLETDIELNQAIELAIVELAKSINAGKAVDSPLCEPGAEGGQALPPEDRPRVVAQ